MLREMTANTSATSSSTATVRLPMIVRYLLVALPFVTMLVIYLWAASHTAHVRLMREWTQSPWELEIVMDAWRAVHHMPVYTDAATDHATHMYGPLGTYVVVPFIKRYGADPRIPRFIAITAALLLCLLMSITLSRRARTWLL